MHTHTYACTHAHAHTVTCRQPPFHGSAQSTHFWVALHFGDDVTDKVEGVLGTLLFQVQM